MCKTQYSDRCTLQNLNFFAEISVFKPLNPSFLPKCTGNRFAFPRPICPYAGLSVVPIVSKVITDCCLSCYTSPCFFVGLCIYIVNFFLLHNKNDGSFTLITITGCSNCWYCCHIEWVHMWCASLWLWECTAVAMECTRLWQIVASAKKRQQTHHLFCYL